MRVNVSGKSTSPIVTKNTMTKILARMCDDYHMGHDNYSFFVNNPDLIGNWLAMDYGVTATSTRFTEKEDEFEITIALIYDFEEDAAFTAFLLLI